MIDLEAVRADLEERLERLATRAREIDARLSEAGDDDWQENAIESEDDEVLESVGRAAIEEARRIRLALTAIDAGTYGTCSGCGKKISAARLEAIPEVTECQRCASLR